MNRKIIPLTLPLAACCLLAACAKPEPPAQAASTQADAQLAQLHEERERNDKNLATFDDLDFNVYSGQKWDEFHRSHAEDILVHYPTAAPPRDCKRIWRN